jgi:hypothetical protein
VQKITCGRARPALRQRRAVEPGHVDVQQQDVRLLLADDRERAFAVADAANDLHARAFGQQLGHARARQRFVIDDQYAHRGCALKMQVREDTA